MKLNAALDYDGTITVDGWLDLAARSASVEVRAAGMAVVLVRERILERILGQPPLENFLEQPCDSRSVIMPKPRNKPSSRAAWPSSFH